MNNDIGHTPSTHSVEETMMVKKQHSRVGSTLLHCLSPVQASMISPTRHTSSKLVPHPDMSSLDEKSFDPSYSSHLDELKRNLPPSRFRNRRRATTVSTWKSPHRNRSSQCDTRRGKLRPRSPLKRVLRTAVPSAQEMDFTSALHEAIDICLRAAEWFDLALRWDAEVLSICQHRLWSPSRVAM